MKIFAHRGMYGCTDIGQEQLSKKDAKGMDLKNLPPENSEISITDAFKNGFGIECDVVMTKDHELIITHTNNLSLHSLDAKHGDYASQKTLSEIMAMKTGMGGQTAPFLTYEKLLEIFKQYPNLNINVEIKGNIDPSGSFAELTEPTIVEKLIEATPQPIFNRIIWSSFAISNLVEMKKLMPKANVAMLFCSDKTDEVRVYPDKLDTYLKFNAVNIQFVLSKIPELCAVHPCIDSLNEETLNICNENKIDVRTWALNEKNPLKNEAAKNDILTVFKMSKEYSNSSYDIITDFSLEVKSLGVE